MILIAYEMIGRESVVNLGTRITMEEFYKCIDKCGVEEFNFYGGQMSWTNGKEGGNRKWVKLDLALVNLPFL